MRPASEVERRRLNDLFAELCAIPSPFGRERAMADRVAGELRALGFRWFDPRDPIPLDAFLRQPDERLHDANAAVAAAHFALDRVGRDLDTLVREAGWGA